jgi:hypothetical protein
VGGGKTVHFQVVWGKLDGWGTFWGCSGGSSIVYHCFKAVVCGPERGREGDPVIVDRHVVDDVAGRVNA